MTRRQALLPFASLLLFTALIWVLWVRPKPVDMAQFAPADSLLYFEANQPAEVLWVLGKTDVWKLLSQVGIAPPISDGGVWQKLVRITGLGPIESVIMARAQIAVVITNLGATESGDSLNVKPEAALIVETHISEGRIRAPIEKRLETLVRSTYLNPQVKHSVVDGVSFIEWRDTNGQVKLIAAFLGSIVIIGNSRQVVDACLAVARGEAPSLRSSPELHTARASSDAANALVFGYIPAVANPKIVSVGIPIFSGQAPADPQFQRLAQNAASKLIGALTWTSRPFRGGIEDRYYIGLPREMAVELSPGFGSPQPTSPSAFSTDFYSISEYRVEDPLQVWQTLRTSISGRVDAVAAVVLNATLRTSLITYGIEAPENFLSAVKSPLKTVRLDQDGQRQLLVASVSDRTKLAQLFTMTMRERGNSAEDTGVSIMENVDGTLGATLSDWLVVIGHPVDVQQYYRLVRESSGDSKQSTRIVDFVESADRAHIVTLTNDAERVRACVTAVMKTYHRELPTDLNGQIAALPYAATQTTLTTDGLVRVTRSPLGQFSSIIPLLLPDKSQLSAQ